MRSLEDLELLSVKEIKLRQDLEDPWRCFIQWQELWGMMHILRPDAIPRYLDSNITSSKVFKQGTVYKQRRKYCTTCAQETFQEKTNIHPWRSSNEDIKVQRLLCVSKYKEEAKVPPINKRETKLRSKAFSRIRRSNICNWDDNHFHAA